MKKPSLGLLLTASDGFDKDKCYIMVPWHMSVCIVEGHSGENETANILAVFMSGRQDRLAVCCLCGAQQQWNPGQKHVLLVSDPRVQKTVPKLQQFPPGPTLTAQEPRTMRNLCERATSAENKRLIAVMANCDTPPM